MTGGGCCAIVEAAQVDRAGGCRRTRKPSCRECTRLTVPVHILSGFLGSGKTCLLNHLLRNAPDGRRMAVIVNDFGTVAVDGDLLDRGSYAMKELSSGCVCCTLTGPLAESLTELTRAERPDVILIESTGVARPDQIARVLTDRTLADLVHCGNVVCVVDAAAVLMLLPNLTVVQDQVKCANTVLVNKVDLVSAETLAEVRSVLATMTPPECLTATCEYCEVDASLVFDERPVYFTTVRSHGRAHAHASPGHSLKSVSFEMAARFHCEGLIGLLQEMKGGVVRAKGIVDTDRGAKLFQLTQTGMDIVDWEREVEVSRLVFIGEDLEEEAIEGKLRDLAKASV